MKRTKTSKPRIDPNGLPVARPCCLRCLRPTAHCVCDLLNPFKAHTNLLILQHPHERRKYYSTAKLVLGCICNSRMLRGIEFKEDFLKQELSGSNFYLLYPGADSVDCETIALSDADTVVALDGTWSEAGKLLHCNPILKKLTKISFSRELKSEYRIRKQPKERYLSTIESIGYLLKLNAAANAETFDPESIQKYDRLFKIFAAMVERQLEYFPRSKKEI